MMEYVEPHHKRTDFAADSFTSSAEGKDRSITFAGHGQHGSVVLREYGSNVVAIVPEAESGFLLWKVQLLEKPKWLTLDFEDNPVLRRIVIYIYRIATDELDVALRSIIGDRSLIYYRRHG